HVRPAIRPPPSASAAVPLPAFAPGFAPLAAVPRRARLWPVLRLLGPPSILILLVSILFAVWLTLLRMAGNTRRKKQTYNRSSHNSDALHGASKHLDA